MKPASTILERVLRLLDLSDGVVAAGSIISQTVCQCESAYYYHQY